MARNEISPPTGFFRTDEQRDVLSSLKLAVTATNEIDAGDEVFWKWLVVGFHSAFVGGMVCHLSGTAEIGALEERSAEKMLAYLNGEIEDYPVTKVAAPEDLYRRLFSSKRRERAGAILPDSRRNKKEFQKLNRIRRDFVHFDPKGWSIEVGYMVTLLLGALPAFDAISRDYWSFRNLEDWERDQLRDHLDSLERWLKGQHELHNMLGTT